MTKPVRLTSKFAVITLIGDHYSTFRNYASSGLSVSDFLVYLGLPALALAASVVFGLRAADVPDILAAIAILTGLIFNAVLLVSDLNARARETKPENRRAQVMELAEQLRANISYAVLLGLALSAFLGAVAMFANTAKPLNHFLTGIILFLGVQLLLTVLMILNRVRALFRSFSSDTEERIP
jgi:hypothetical protein